MKRLRQIFMVALVLFLISLVNGRTTQIDSAHAAAPRKFSPSTSTYTYSNTDVETGQGFDLCNTPTLSQMQNWWDGTPYDWVGTYLAGSENLAPGCNLSNLSSSWTLGVRSQGWSLVPTWSGLNAPCSNLNTNTMSYNGSIAFNQGQADAQSAARAAENVSIGPGSIIYGDIEYYPEGNSQCDLAVANFVNGWSGELHALGFEAGIYESASNLSSLCGYAGAITPPDDIWIAAWDNDVSQSDIANLSPNGCWVYSQRLHQYQGSTTLNYNGSQLTVDLDSADGGTADGFSAS